MLRLKTGMPFSTIAIEEVLAPKSTNIIIDLSLPTNDLIRAKFSVSKLKRVKPETLKISTYFFTKFLLAPVRSIFKFFCDLENILLIGLFC